MPLSPRLRFRHFRTFLALCEHGSLTKAAEHLNTVQPALSRTLREIEEEVGRELFVRGARGLTLTPDGETLRRHLTAGMAQIENGIAQAGGRKRSETVALGMLPNVARELVPGALQRFKRSLPEVTVRLHWASVPELVDMLRKGQIDFIASRLVSVEQLAGVLFEHLYDEPLIFAVRNGHPICSLESVSLDDVSNFPVVVPLPGVIIREELDRFLFARGHAMFENRIETVSFEFARSYMQMEDVVVFLPEGSLHKELQEGRAVRLDLSDEELVGAVGLSHLADRDLSAAARRLVADLRATAMDLSKI